MEFTDSDVAISINGHLLILTSLLVNPDTHSQVLFGLSPPGDRERLLTLTTMSAKRKAVHGTFGPGPLRYSIQYHSMSLTEEGVFV